MENLNETNLENINFGWKLTYDLDELKTWGHRSGWLRVMENIISNSNKNSDKKILLIDVIEKKFLWDYQSINDLPSEPFVTFWHNPHNMPSWIDNHPDVILNDRDKRECLEKYCKGIFVFSNYLAKYIKSKINVPVNVLYHPTDIPENKFSWTKFMENSNKKLIQLGYWLRKTTWIFQIKSSVYEKYWCYGTKTAFSYLKLDVQNEHVDIDDSVTCVRVDDFQYDLLLSENIAVIYLHDSSVNNSIIECITRFTPIILNYHPAVVEYLGEDYPLYYSNLEECENLIHNFNKLKQAHLYLQKEELQHKIRYDTFIDSFINSDIIKNCN